MDLLLLYLRSFVIGPYLKGKEEIPDDMARAILDIPSMPQNCYECPMRRRYRRKWFCQIIMHIALKDQRRPDCPLVEMERSGTHEDYEVIRGKDHRDTGNV